MYQINIIDIYIKQFQYTIIIIFYNVFCNTWSVYALVRVDNGWRHIFSHVAQSAEFTTIGLAEVVEGGVGTQVVTILDAIWMLVLTRLNWNRNKMRLWTHRGHENIFFITRVPYKFKVN